MIEYNGDFSFYVGTVRDFVEFFQQQQQDGEGEAPEQEPPQQLRKIIVTLQDCTVRDMQRFVLLFQNSRTCPIIETIKDIRLADIDREAVEDAAEYDSLISQLIRLLQHLPLQTTTVHISAHEQCTNLLQAVSCNTHLKKFILEHATIDAEDARILAEDLIPRNPLELLVVFSTNLENEGGSILMRAALDPGISKIRKLLLNFNLITEIYPEAVELLKINTCLQELHLRRNRIGDIGAALISSALTINASLVHLGLAGCGIGDEGCSALGQALLVNETLLELDLSHNAFGDDGVHSLTSCLRHNSTLESLYVNSCRQVTEQGAQELVVLVQHYLLKLDVTLEVVGDRPPRYPQHQALLASGYNFNCRFFDAYERIRNSDTANDDGDARDHEDGDGWGHNRDVEGGDDEDDGRHEEDSIRFLLPLVGSTHSLIKPSVLCLLARRDPEAAVRALDTILNNSSAQDA